MGVALLGPLLAGASYPAGSAADAALVSDHVLIDEDEDRIALTPESWDGERTVILTPGDQVEPQACAPPLTSWPRPVWRPGSSRHRWTCCPQTPPG